MTLTIELDLPADLARVRLPDALAARLQDLLDRQDSGQPLTEQERGEAEGLVNLAEFLTVPRLRAERSAGCGTSPGPAGWQSPRVRKWSLTPRGPAGSG